MIAHPALSPEIYGENNRFPLFWEMGPEITVIPQGLSSQGPRVDGVVSYIPFRRSLEEAPLAA